MKKKKEGTLLAGLMWFTLLYCSMAVGVGFTVGQNFVYLLDDIIRYYLSLPVG